jgi:uncharacterized protein (DUF1501 family)
MLAMTDFLSFAIKNRRTMKEMKKDSGFSISRREMLKCGLLGTAGFFLWNCGILNAQAAKETKQKTKGKAKSVIEIWLWGGPAHLETFDPKPSAGYDYNGGFKSIPTNVSGIEISEYLPNLAKIADKYSLIRSLTHGINGHETATYYMQTGRKAGGKVFPAIGAIIAMMKGYDYGYEGKISPFVVLTESKGRFSELGFLHPKYRPFVTGGNPAAGTFAVEGIVNPSLSKEQQKTNRAFLKEMDSLDNVMPDNPQFKNFDTAQEEAYELITGKAGEVFDLNKESTETRDFYGRNWCGQSCLAARRLVEIGVPYICLNFNGWDTHKQHFQAMRTKLPQLDQGLFALINDLEKKGLLKTTLIWCAGEFGRQPKVSWESPWNGGRQHYGQCFSALVAGGGFKGGCVVGKSDGKGEETTERPVYPEDFLGSICELAGVDPDGLMPNPMGEKITVMPPESEYGRLREIYI